MRNSEASDVTRAAGHTTVTPFKSQYKVQKVQKARLQKRVAAHAGSTLFNTNSSQASVSFAELKSIARKLLPKSSMVRRLILAESDFVPRESAVAKMEIFSRMLREELG